MQDEAKKGGETPEEEITLDPSEGEDSPPAQDLFLETIEELSRERDEYQDLLLRKQAEFENFRKRVNREKAELEEASRAEVLAELLPVFDSASKGLQTLRELDPGPELEPFLEGYELLVKALEGALERFQVSPVPGVGARFDPNLHEAILREVGTDLTDGEILEEYRSGYEMNGRLLRPSQVKVAVRSTPASAAPATADKD